MNPLNEKVGPRSREADLNLNPAEDTESIPDFSTVDSIINGIESAFSKSHEQDIVNRKQLSIHELLALNIQEIPTLVEPIFQKVGLACLAGPSDSGKSMLLRQLAIAVANGERDFLGFKLNLNHKSAIYLCSEDDASAIAMLLNRQSQYFDIRPEAKLRFLFDTHEPKQQIEEMLKADPADLVVIDCFLDVFGSDVKDSVKIRQFLNPWQEIANKHQCLILFLHHAGKRTEIGEPSKNNLLGGQGFESKMRMVIELRQDEIRDDWRHLCIVKGNYVGPKMKRASFVLRMDESFIFHSTGERVPFELLSRKEGDQKDRAKYEAACEMRNQGKSLSEIAEALGYSNKGAVSKLLSRHEGNQIRNNDVPPF